VHNAFRVVCCKKNIADVFAYIGQTVEEFADIGQLKLTNKSSCPSGSPVTRQT